jgi:hypothetical protein
VGVAAVLVGAFLTYCSQAAKQAAELKAETATQALSTVLSAVQTRMGIL